MTTQIEAMKMALEALDLHCGTKADERKPGGAIPALRAAIEQAEKCEPVENMYQVIGMSVLKDQTYQDGYFIAYGDEDRICEMFYKQLRYHFSPPSAEIEELEHQLAECQRERDELKKRFEGLIRKPPPSRFG